MKNGQVKQQGNEPCMALNKTQPFSTESTNFFSHLHIPSIPEKISGAAPSAERHGSHGSHGSCNVNRA